MDDKRKLSQEIFNPISDGVQKLAQLFPSAVKDGEVDFNALKEELGEFTSVGAEKYELNWAGKANAKRIAREDIPGRTLKYVPQDSKNADTTENLYIEGDNLEVLKLLRQNYYGAIKMIYIDPPYNTGNDFVYRDNFTMSEEESAEAEGETVDGERMIINQKSTNRFHANWLNMMYPRLKVAKDLLTEDGVIFISIDDNEVDNLKKLSNDVFGEENFVTQLVWEKKKKGSFLSNAITNIKEYILVYCKANLTFKGLIGEINADTETYPCINASNKRELRTIPAGIESKYKQSDYFLKKGTEISDTTMSIVLHSDLVIKGGILAQELTLEGNWRYSQSVMTEYANNHELYITRDLYLRRIVNEARYKTLKDILPRVGNDNNSLYNSKINLNNLLDSGWGSNEDADEELRLIFGIQKLMDYPKPTRLIEKLLSSARDKECFVIDFFSGSATTAHAVMQLNAEDGGSRKFIMVQMPEVCKEDGEAYKAGFKNICEIGKERIRRAGEKIKAEIEEQNVQLKLGEEPKQVPDIGFKVFRTADTNIRWTHEALKAGQIHVEESMLSNKDKLDFMPGFKDIDVVYEVLLRQRDVPLSAKVERRNEIGERTYLIANTYLVCLEETITKDMLEKLAAIEPLPMKYILRDSAFEDNISLKDETIRRLEAMIARNSGENEQTYTVEFI